MSRKLKNILMGSLLIVLIATSCLTVYFANSSEYNGKMMMQESGEVPP